MDKRFYQSRVGKFSQKDIDDLNILKAVHLSKLLERAKLNKNVTLHSSWKTIETIDNLLLMNTGRKYLLNAGFKLPKLEFNTKKER
jgi:hypothetical protein